MSGLVTLFDLVICLFYHKFLYKTTPFGGERERASLSPLPQMILQSPTEGRSSVWGLRPRLA